MGRVDIFCTRLDLSAKMMAEGLLNGCSTNLSFPRTLITLFRRLFLISRDQRLIL